MKLKNILVTNEKRELVYVGEDIRPVVMNVYMSEPLGYGAGRMMMDDEFLLFLPDVSIISEEERKRIEMGSGARLPQNGIVILVAVYRNLDTQYLLKRIEPHNLQEPILMDTVFYGHEIIVQRNKERDDGLTIQIDNQRIQTAENVVAAVIFNEKGIRYFWVKPSDVAIYVERGAADIGVAGKDILLEYAPDVYELLDLGLGKCRMAVAGKTDFKDDTEKTLRVATKFVNIAMNYYSGKSRDIDIIKLNGSIELAPILGLSDVIVDIVETGATLKENNLTPLEDIVPISARLIANKASFKFKTAQIEAIRDAIASQTEVGK